MDYYLFKRTKKRSGKKVYYAAFFKEPGKYETVKSTKTGNETLAHKVARGMIAEGKVFAVRDLLKDYLLDFWTPGKSEHLTSFQAEKGKTHAAAYVVGNRSAIEKYFLPYFAEHKITKLSDLTRSNLLGWRNFLFEKGTSPRVINRTRTAVWTALHWAVKMGELPFHPGQYVDPVKPQKTERPIFELAELSKLFEKPWPDFRCYAGAALAATTGMRIGEVRGLQVKNLHLAEGYLDVIGNWQDEEGEGLKLKPPKWDSERIGVTIPPPTVKALAKVLRLHRWGAQPEHFVFFSTDSPTWPLNKHTLGTALARACKAAGIPARSFHSFRHSFITHASGLSPAALRYHVGHSNAETTERYQHLSEADRKALVEVQAKILPE